MFWYSTICLSSNQLENKNLSRPVYLREYRAIRPARLEPEGCQVNPSERSPHGLPPSTARGRQSGSSMGKWEASQTAFLLVCLLQPNFMMFLFQILSPQNNWDSHISINVKKYKHISVFSLLPTQLFFE